MQFSQWFYEHKSHPLTVDDIMIWPTDGTPRTPPVGWEPEMMNTSSASALRMAYNKKIPPNQARQIADFVYLFSGHPLNYEKRLLTWISNQMGEDSDMSKILAKKRELEPMTNRAKEYHKMLMSKNYSLPTQGRPNGITKTILLS